MYVIEIANLSIFIQKISYFLNFIIHETKANLEGNNGIFYILLQHKQLGNNTYYPRKKFVLQSAMFLLEILDSFLSLILYIIHKKNESIGVKETDNLIKIKDLLSLFQEYSIQWDKDFFRLLFLFFK